MSYPTRPFVVIDDAGQPVGDMPTPLLIQQGGGEAYRDPESLSIWRARDDAYDRQLAEKIALQNGREASDWRLFMPTYTKVRVVRLKECPGAKTAWNMAHFVPFGEPVYGPRSQCYDDATYDGIATGDELAARRES